MNLMDSLTEAFVYICVLFFGLLTKLAPFLVTDMYLLVPPLNAKSTIRQERTKVYHVEY